jgi:hypothetical protein
VPHDQALARTVDDVAANFSPGPTQFVRAAASTAASVLRAALAVAGRGRGGGAGILNGNAGMVTGRCSLALRLVRAGRKREAEERRAGQNLYLH